MTDRGHFGRLTFQFRIQICVYLLPRSHTLHPGAEAFSEAVLDGMASPPMGYSDDEEANGGGESPQRPRPLGAGAGAAADTTLASAAEALLLGAERGRLGGT